MEQRLRSTMSVGRARCPMQKGEMAGKLFDRFGVFDYFPSHSLPSEVKIHEVMVLFLLFSS
jgi:hypothetical protein